MRKCNKYNKKPEHVEELSSVHQSVPETFETTSTGRIFKEIGANMGDIQDQESEEAHFSKIVALGRREGWLADAACCGPVSRARPLRL